MDDYVWRQRARIIGYLDLIIPIFLFIYTIICGGTLLDLLTPRELSIKIFAIASVVVMVIMAVIYIMTALRLIEATIPNPIPERALNRAKIWRNVTVILLIVKIILAGVRFDVMTILISLIVRGFFLYVVWEYMRELKERISSLDTHPATPPESVVVTKE